MPAPTRASLIDAVNERDEAVGTVARGEVLKAGQNFRTAHVFIVNNDHELLLQRLAGGRDRHPGRWGSSVAAYLFAGESYESGARRRLAEELGLTASLRPVGKLEMLDEHSIKFVCLFLAHSEVASNREPSHIAELRFSPIERIKREIRSDPESFTPTFAELFRSFGSSLS